ncbi:MAG TPA: helicase-related protein [Candidatus Paceibacterota bacterium]
MHTLPVTAFRSKITEAVQSNPVTIIVAETGAGKSTQVPQFLLEDGWRLVVTQPRRLAARSLAERVAFEQKTRLGHVIGYRTSQERRDSSKTRVLFCTDGLALVRELVGKSKRDVLVIDEVHEWNLNIEVLIAWAKRELAGKPDFKLVIMSATVESERLSAYFDNAPIVNVPGRLFPIEERKAGGSVVTDAAELLRQGHNVLVFQPGEREIAETIRELSRSGIEAEILPLHGELTPEEQGRCFKHYPKPKCIVATNIAQTSVTIDDIAVVVDSGMEKRIETVSGVEGLYIKPISFADRDQRKGRAGRTKVGIYIDHCKAWSRPDYPVPEILRHRLDQVTLRLAQAGLDAEKLDFFHQPDKAALHEAKRALVALGCMEKSGTVTAIGKRVATMPISASFGRMIVEADKLGVVGDVAAIAAILEQGEVTQRHSHAWLRLCNGESDSDALAQLAVLKASRGMSNEEMEKSGIFPPAVGRVIEMIKHLARSLHGMVASFESSGKREDTIRAICSGMADHLYHRRGRRYFNGDETGQGRELSKQSVVCQPQWVVALPFDLETKVDIGGKKKLQFLGMATRVTPEWLAENVPTAGQEVNERLAELDLAGKIERLRGRCWTLWFEHQSSGRLPAAVLEQLSRLSSPYNIEGRLGKEQEAWFVEISEAISRAEQVLGLGSAFRGQRSG